MEENSTKGDKNLTLDQPEAQPNTQSKDKDSDSLISQGTKSEAGGTNSEVNSQISTSSAGELKSLLTKAYSIISEKEKELDQAYKIKKALLNENSQLKSQLEELQDTLSIKSARSSLNRSPTKFSNDVDEVGIDSTSSYPKRSRRNTIHSELEGIAELEEQNLELQAKIEELIKDKENIEKKDSRQMTLMEEEIVYLKREYDNAILRVKELEASNIDVLRRLRNTPVSIPTPNPVRRNSHSVAQSLPTIPDLPSPTNQYGIAKKEEEPLPLENEPLSAEEEKEFIMALIENINELNKVNQSLNVAKREADERIKNLETSIDTLRNHVTTLEFKLKDSQDQSEIIDQQTKQIANLTAKLESQRGGLINQLFSSSRSTVSSINTTKTKGNNPPINVHDDPRFNSIKNHRKVVSTSSINTSIPIKYTLLYELEGEYNRNFSRTEGSQADQIEWIQDSKSQSSTSANGHEAKLNSVSQHGHGRRLHNIKGSSLARVDDEIDEVEELEEQVYEPNPLTIHAERGWFDDETQPLLPNSPPPPDQHVGIVQMVRRCFSSIWKWCRFITLLFAAVGMAVYRGPDADISEFYYD